MTKSLIRSGLLVSMIASGCGRPPVPPEGIEQRMDRILAGLRPAIAIRGEAPVRWTLADRMAHWKVPGLSIALVDSGRIVFARGYGVREAGTTDSVDNETVFQAGSISKPTFALGAMQLVQEGKLSLDEDVNRKLVGWKVPENRFTKVEKVTLRRLLSHTAGLTIHGFPGYPVGSPLPTLLQTLDGKPPANTQPVRVDTTPGAISRYSGGGTMVAMLLAQETTGRPFVEWIAETVLRPAGMARSGYHQPLDSALARNAATGHSGAGAAMEGRWFVYPELAAAGLWTTPSDLARLAIELESTWAGRSSRIVGKATLDSMLVAQPSGDGQDGERFGLGYAVDRTGGDLEFSHGGSTQGYQALFVVFPKRRQAVAVMTNGDSGSQLIEELMASIAAELGWPTHHPREKVAIAVDSARKAGLVGEYAIEIGSPQPLPAVVRLEGTRLILEAPIGAIGTTELLADSDSTFFTRDIALPVQFELDASGRAVAIVVAGGARGKRVK